MSPLQSPTEHLEVYLLSLRVGVTLLGRMDRHPGRDPAARRALLEALRSALEGVESCLTCRAADEETQATARQHGPIIITALQACRLAGKIKERKTA